MPKILLFLLADTGQKQTIAGYVLNVSPIKYAKRTNKPYFNADFETDKRVTDLVCFSPSKRELFAQVATNRGGCEITNANTNDQTIIVSDYSTVRAKELGFTRNSVYTFKTVAEVINEIALDSTINTRGVLALDEVRHLDVSNEKIPIREGFLIDETGSVKITLWREYTRLEDGVTYDLLKVVKIKYAGEERLQTVHNTMYERSLEQVENYIIPERNQPEVLRDASIIAIEEDSLLLCGICKSTAFPGNKPLYTCGDCKSTMLTDKLRKKSVKKVTVQNGADRFKLNCHLQNVSRCFPDKNTELMDTEQLTLLLLTNTFVITYENTTGNVVNLEKQE